MTTINDIVLIYIEDKPLSFARVEAISPDHKKDWFQIKLLMFQIPLQVVTWILKDDYINGAHFQMNGQKMCMEKVVCPDMEVSEVEDPETISEETKHLVQESEGKVISLSDFRNKKQ